MDKPRPDIARLSGSPELGSSGFDVAWAPTDLTAGPHTLYVYSMVDGTWTMQTRQVVGAGNVLPPERDSARRDGDEMDNGPVGGDAVLD